MQLLPHTINYDLARLSHTRVALQIFLTNCIIMYEGSAAIAGKQRKGALEQPVTLVSSLLCA